MDGISTAVLKAEVMAMDAIENAYDKAREEINEFAHEHTMLGSNWDINNVFKNTGNLLRTIGAGLLVVVGIAMIIVGIVKIAQGLISHGKTQVNWVINIALILVGALFCAGAAFFNNTLTNEEGLGKTLSDELENLGQ